MAAFLFTLLVFWFLTIWWFFSMWVSDIINYKPALWMTFFFGVHGAILATLMKICKDYNTVNQTVKEDTQEDSQLLLD